MDQSLYSAAREPLWSLEAAQAARSTTMNNALATQDRQVMAVACTYDVQASLVCPMQSSASGTYHSQGHAAVTDTYTVPVKADNTFGNMSTSGPANLRTVQQAQHGDTQNRWIAGVVG